MKENVIRSNFRGYAQETAVERIFFLKHPNFLNGMLGILVWSVKQPESACCRLSLYLILRDSRKTFQRLTFNTVGPLRFLNSDAIHPASDKTWLFLILIVNYCEIAWLRLPTHGRILPTAFSVWSFISSATPRSQKMFIYHKSSVTISSPTFFFHGSIKTQPF